MLAQRGVDVKREAVKPSVVEEKKSRRGSARSHTKTPAQLQREARAGNPAEDDCEIAGRDCETAAACSTIPISTPGTARDSTKLRAAIAKAQNELAAAEDRWLELEVLREEIEQA